MACAELSFWHLNGVTQENDNKFQSSYLVCKPRNASIISQIQGTSASRSTTGFCYYDLL